MTEGRKRQSGKNDLCYKLHFSKCFHISANFSVSRFCKADNYLLASPFNIGNPKSVCTFHQGGHQCTRCTRFTRFKSSSVHRLSFRGACVPVWQLRIAVRWTLGSRKHFSIDDLFKWLLAPFFINRGSVRGYFL